ncbi:MAG TPA: GNAT family N-acetyltransferase [Casimicrobiaceae bacterium]|nr:GNAT family N-acetyltransferase [Casimicrobiaceae bacterium]
MKRFAARFPRAILRHRASPGALPINGTRRVARRRIDAPAPGQLSTWGKRMREPADNARGAGVAVRRMKPQDAVLHQHFIARLNPDDLRFRFGSRVSDVSDTELDTIANVDLDRETTFVATMPSIGGAREIVGEVRLQKDRDSATFEFAIAVRSDLQGRGLGRRLLRKAIAWCRQRRAQSLYGLVNASNSAMIALARRLGFDVDEVPGGATVVVSLEM